MTAADRKTEQTWDALRERLARANTAAEQSLAPSPQEDRELLEQRARILGQPPIQAATPGAMLELVFFDLAGEAYALETRYVREVLGAGEITLIPRAPAFVLGVANLRGELLPIFDLRAAFTQGAPHATDLSRILVIGLAQAEFGIVVDEVREVAKLVAAEVTASAASELAVKNAYVRGVTADARVVLDGAVLLSDSALSITPQPHPAS